MTQWTNDSQMMNAGCYKIVHEGRAIQERTMDFNVAEEKEIQWYGFRFQVAANLRESTICEYGV